MSVLLVHFSGGGRKRVTGTESSSPLFFSCFGPCDGRARESTLEPVLFFAYAAAATTALEESRANCDTQDKEDFFVRNSPSPDRKRFCAMCIPSQQFDLENELGWNPSHPQNHRYHDRQRGHGPKGHDPSHSIGLAHILLGNHLK